MFSLRVKELSDLRLVQQGMNVKYTMSWDSASQLLRQQSTRFDEEYLRSFLLTFRQFLSKDEPIFIERVFNDCVRLIESDHFKDQLTAARRSWKSSFYKMGGLNVTIDDENMTGEYVLDLWINGHYFHNDAAKADALRRLLGSDVHLFRFKFMESLASLTQVILYTGAVVEYALRAGLFHFDEE